MADAHPAKTGLLLGGGVLIGLLVIGSRTKVGAEMANQAQASIGEGFEWLSRVISRTSGHEGSYTSINPNRDGAGLSFGMLQWSQRTGALGTLLREMNLADSGRFSLIFGKQAQRLLDVTAKASLEPVEGALLWQEPWLRRFKVAGAEPAFQAVQDRLAGAGVYMQAAQLAVQTLGLITERSLSLAYDTAVQQGPGAARSIAKRVRKALAGRVVLPRQVLETYVAFAAAPFRAAAEPAKSTRRGLEWRPIGREWHLFAGSIDLYVDVFRRRTAIVNDPGLGDEPRQLPA